MKLESLTTGVTEVAVDTEVGVTEVTEGRKGIPKCGKKNLENVLLFLAFLSPWSCSSP